MDQYRSYIWVIKENTKPNSFNVKDRWKFLDHMEDGLKDLLNYYESFCTELADFEHNSSAEKGEKTISELQMELVENNPSARKQNQQLEIIEEKDSMPTTSDYSPVDRVETEPIRRKRESWSSLFRRSKANRGCKSFNSMWQSVSSSSGGIDIDDNPNELASSSTTQSKIQHELSSSSTFSNEFVPMELEEDLESEERTFQSKPSSTYVESNEEFMYCTKDLLPGPLNLDWIKKFEDDKPSYSKETGKTTKEAFPLQQKLRQVWTERDTKRKTEPTNDCLNYTGHLGSDSNSKISSYMNVNPLLTDEKSTFRGITARSNLFTNRKDTQRKVHNEEIQDYCDRISKMVNMMDESCDSNPFQDWEDTESEHSKVDSFRLT